MHVDSQHKIKDNCYSVMFIVAIIPLMFSQSTQIKSMRLAEGASAYPLVADSPRAPARPLGGKDWSVYVGALPPADA